MGLRPRGSGEPEEVIASAHNFSQLETQNSLHLRQIQGHMLLPAFLQSSHGKDIQPSMEEARLQRAWASSSSYLQAPTYENSITLKF